MPRPSRCRKVCRLPKCCLFQSILKTPSRLEAQWRANAPLNAEKDSAAQIVVITVSEYEALRLLDYLGLTQVEAARQMQVARTTVQRIYNNARKKLAAFIVEGLSLKIEGGNFELCRQKTDRCRCGACRAQNGQTRTVNNNEGKK